MRYGCLHYVSEHMAIEMNFEQECIPIECVTPALYRTGGLPDRDPPWTETPPTPRQTPSPDRDPPGQTTLPHHQVKLSQHLIVSNSFHSHKIFALDSVHTGRVIMDDRACTSTNALRFVVAIFRVDYLKIHSHQIVFFVSGILKHKRR